MDVAALAVSVVAAAGSLGAVWYTRRAARSAALAAKAADTTAALDLERRHTERTPQFDITCVVGDNGLGDQGTLLVTLAGPGRGDVLDEVTITILDEAGIDHWGHGFPTGVSKEEAHLFVWGPWEFNTGASAQVSDNRTTRPRPYSRPDGRNWDRLSIQRTRPGRWMHMNPGQWQREREGPIRLKIACSRAGERWDLLYEAKPSS